MDWSKAKTVLIIAFIITNLFLGFKIQQNTYRASSFSKISNEYVREIIELLEQRNIKIKGDIPRKIISKGNLTVEYRKIDTSFLKEGFFDIGEKIQERISDDIVTYIQGAKNLKVVKEKKIEFKDERNIIPIEDKEVDSVKKKAVEIIKALGWSKEELELDEIDIENGILHIKYTQKYKDKVVDGGSYIRMDIDGLGIISFQSLWLDVVKESKSNTTIIPATEALFNLITFTDDIVVTDISLGYYIPTDFGHFKGINNEYNWEYIYQNQAIPIWRIKLDSGNKLYIDAYTGKPIN